MDLNYRLAGEIPIKNEQQLAIIEELKLATIYLPFTVRDTPYNRGCVGLGEIEMNGTFFEEYMNTSNTLQKTDLDSSSPEINADPFVYKITSDAIIVHRMPVTNGEPVETKEAIAHEIPTGETVPYRAPVTGMIADESQVSKTIPTIAPTGGVVTHEVPGTTNAGLLAALFSQEESENFHARWNEIQGKFVDDPRSAVQQADGLVSEVVEKIIQIFANEHNCLEGQWNQGNNVSTEDLRQALQQYRTFFHRLVI